MTNSKPKLAWMPKMPMPTREPEMEPDLKHQFRDGTVVDNSENPEPSLVSGPPDPSASPVQLQDPIYTVPISPNSSPQSTNPSPVEIAKADQASMANFPVNPQPYLVAGLTVEHGWNRPARGRMALGGEPTREHEDYAIVSINPMPAHADQLRPTLNLVCDFLEHSQRVRILASHLSPLGLGLIKLRTVAQHDQLVRVSPLQLGQNHQVTIVKHNEGINVRSCAYVRVYWIMFFAFPLDFQKDLYIRAAVAPYGRLLEWYKDDNKSRILAQVLLLSPNRVPRSLIVSRGTMIGGMGRSWSVPAFILNGHFPDAFPADEDLVPFDGDAHPEHPPVVLGPHPQQDPDWQEEHNGAAEGMGAFGGDPHP